MGNLIKRQNSLCSEPERSWVKALRTEEGTRNQTHQRTTKSYHNSLSQRKWYHKIMQSTQKLVYYYRLSEAMAHLGLTARQLEYLHNKKVVEWSILHRQRVYDLERLRRICLVMELRKRGLSLKTIKRLLDLCPGELPADGWFVTDGKKLVAFPATQEAAVSLAAETDAALCVVSLTTNV